MKNLFQGSNCNPSQIEANSNQFKRMVDTMMIGTQNPNQIIQFSNQGSNIQDQIRNREIAFHQMNKIWEQQQKNVNLETKMMEQYMLQQKIQYQKQISAIQQMQWNRLRISQQAREMENQFIMKQKYKQALINKQQMRIKNIIPMDLNKMFQDTEPRFKNSQYLKFLSKYNKGQIIIQGQQIKQKPKTTEQKMNQAFENSTKQIKETNEKQLKILQNQFKQAEQQVNKQQELMKNKYNQQEQKFVKTLTPEQRYNYQWSKRLVQYEQQRNNTQQFQKILQQKYINSLKQSELDLTDAWQGAADLQQQHIFGDFRDQYLWTKNNPYLDVALPLNKALQYMNQGRNNQAILFLQSHLQKNKNDSQSWRILGRILQQNDHDCRSVPCFVTSLKYDPNNLDSLLELGVSCANISYEVKSMNYLKKWLILNPKYKAIKIDPNIITDQIANRQDFKPAQIIAINKNIINVFNQAVKIDPQDHKLLTATAVLYFIQRQYQKAAEYFHAAAMKDTHNYSLWNKLGATLAHLGKAEQAIDCYHNALDIKPNYVKVWINLGIIHSFIGAYQQATRFYLNALSFRPDAKQIWAYVHSCFMHMKRYDLIKLIAKQDPLAFPEFDVIKLEELPIPQIEYMKSTKQYIIGEEAEKWSRQFLK